MKTMLTKYMVLFAVLLLISGCQAPIELPQTADSPAEKGSFSLVIDGVRAGRTIMPVIQQAELVAYTLTFFSESVDDSVVMVNKTTANLSEPVDLYAGTWSVLVTAYLDADRTKPAAQGSLPEVVITSGENASGSVTLSQITAAGSGQGTFSWDITYPDSGITTASIDITRLSGSTETPVGTWFIVGGTSNTKNKQDSLSLNAGYYRVIFTLIDSNNKSVQWVEILHVYDNMNSAFTHEFTQEQFLYTIYTVTFDSQGGTTVPSQSVFKNTTAARPVKPTRSTITNTSTTNYNFTGWYTSTQTNAPLYDFDVPVTGNITLYAKWNQAGQEGIYVGIIKFADTATDITTSSGTPPILLTSSSTSTLVSRLSSSSYYYKASNIGTAMFYGVHKALETLKNREAYYPTNIDSVSIVTFTDGLDNQSAGLSKLGNAIEGKTFDSNALYAAYVKDEIENRRIADLPITAYSVGVQGTDVTDDTAFQNNLIAIASPGNHNVLDNFAGVQSIFNGIADGLNIIQGTTASFTMKTTLLDPGTRVRMTFDLDANNNSISASQRYIEGTIGYVDSTYTFNDITYVGGVASAAGEGPLIGTVSGTVNFVFENITILNQNTGLPTAYNPAPNMTRQWLIYSGGSTWGPNSEYSSDGSSTTTVERRSAIIYLVLDCSTSLSDDQVSQIRNAATSFINTLYDRYTNNTTVGGGTRDITIAMWDSYGDGWDSSAALRISVNGINRTTNARLSGGSGPGYYNFAANPGDYVTLYWVNGGSNDRECAFAVYYTNNPPSPMFNPSSGTTSGNVLVSKRYNYPTGAVGSGTNMGSFTVQ